MRGEGGGVGEEEVLEAGQAQADQHHKQQQPHPEGEG